MPDGPGEGQPVKVVRNGAGGTKRVWKLATRSQAPSGRAPRRPSPEERRGWPSGPHRRSRRASAHRARHGSRRSPGGWNPWSDPDRVTMPPRRSRPPRGAAATGRWKDSSWTGRGGTQSAAGEPRGSPSSDGRTNGSRPPWDWISILSPMQAPGAPTALRQSGSRPLVDCRAAARRPFPRGRALLAR